MGLNPGTSGIKTVVITPPATEPVTLVEQKLHMRVDVTVIIDDALITSLIKAARLHLEAITGRSFVTRTLDLFLDAFPDNDCPIRLSDVPVIAVTQFEYTLDGAGSPTTFPTSDFLLDEKNEPALIHLRTSKSWPGDTLEPANGVRIRFSAGFGTAAAVPEDIKAAIKLFAAHLYENREEVARGLGVGGTFAELPQGVRALLANHLKGHC